MDKENNSASTSASNIIQDNNSNVDEGMLKILRKERDDIIKQKILSGTSMNMIQKTIKAQEDELTRLSDIHSELELQNRQVKEADEIENQTKLNLDNDIENMKSMTEIFLEQLSQLRNVLENVEANTENIGKSKASVSTEIVKYLKEQKLKENCYKEEIEKMQELLNSDVGKYNDEIQDLELSFYNKLENLSKLNKEEHNLIGVIEEGESENSQLLIHLQKNRTDKDNLLDEIDVFHNKFTEANEEHNNKKASYESQIEILEANKAEKEERFANLQSKIDSLKQENNKIDEETSKDQSDLNNLDTVQSEVEEMLTNLISTQDQLIANIAENRRKKSFEITSLEETFHQTETNNETIKEINKKLQQQLEDKKKITKGLKEKLFELNQDQEEIIKQIKEIQTKNKENSSDYEKTICESNSEIEEKQLKNKDKREAVEAVKRENEEKEQAISRLKDNIRNKTDKKNTNRQYKFTIFKSNKEELKSINKELQSTLSELENVKRTYEIKIKAIEKSYNDKINKIQKETNLFREKIDITMKNDNDKHIKEKRSLEDSSKIMNLQINELQTSKENLQDELANKLKEILDVTYKIDTAKLRKTHSESVFKPPILPTKTRKTRTTSTPKTSLKKPTENPQTFTQKTQKSIQSENPYDSSDDIFPLSQKNITTSTPKTILKKPEKLTQKNLDDNFPLTQKNIATSTPKTILKKPEKLTQKNLDDNFSLTEKNITTSTPKTNMKKPAEKPEKLTQKSQKGKQTLSSIQEKQDDSSEEIFPLTQKDNTTSTSKTIIKKPVVKLEKLTQNTQKEKQILSPIQAENLDDSYNKNLPLTQKNEPTNFPKTKNISMTQKTVPKKDFPLSPLVKYQSLTTNFDKIEKIEPKKVEISVKKWQNISCGWPTDNETSDDGFKRFNKAKNIVTSTQKTQENISPVLRQKKRIYDFLSSENENSENLKETKKAKESLPKENKKTNYWDKESNSSDDSFFGKLGKSKKIQSEMKKNEKIPEPTSTINLDSSSSY